VLGHVGSSRLYESIAIHFYHPGLQNLIDELVSRCDTCQRYKLPGRGYGESPARQAPLTPWSEVAVDLIGPWKVTVRGQEIEFNALTCIDPVTNLVELCRISNKTAAHVGQMFKNSWLARYPRPLRCIHDQGSEFKGDDFQRILRRFGIKDSPTTVRNPQANAVCERMHQTVGNVLRTLLHGHAPQHLQGAEQLVDSALATTMHVMRSTIHRTLRIAPGALVFQRDMFLDIPLLADLRAIQERRQVLIDENLRRLNNRRISHDYQQGERVLLLVPSPRKLEGNSSGPHQIVQVHADGTLSIQRTPHLIERVNIRQLLPYRS
jgi:transposase InsO family protein